MNSRCHECAYRGKPTDKVCVMGNRVPWQSACVYFTPRGCLGIIDERETGKELQSDAYDGRMDVECVALCDALNKIPKMCTSGSCSGHDKEPLRIWLQVYDMRSLYVVGRALDRRYGGPSPEWKCCVSASDTDMETDSLGFCLESPCVGMRAYRGALVIANNVKDFMGNPEWVQIALGV